MAKKVKQKIEKVDGGLDADLVKKLRSAIRLVWQRSSHARKLVVNRCKSFEGDFSFCELCNAKVGKIYVDHIRNIGDVDEGFIKRMFVSSKEMQGLCKKCHDKKTAEERKLAKKVAADKERNAPPEHLYFNNEGKAVGGFYLEEIQRDHIDSLGVFEADRNRILYDHVMGRTPNSRCVQAPLTKTKVKRSKKKKAP